MSDTGHTNRLAKEPSLYLRQHGHNPVDWYPWGEDAFERARSEDKPILLSIGYSSCHWCHVMERECFENEEIARLMNDLFVCIKVDREERPDVDDVYMKTVQMMTGRGGWPMTVFASPDLRPYYAGTYFPPEDRGGMPGFPRVLAGAAQAYREQAKEVAESGARVIELLSHDHAGPASATPVSEDFGAAASALARNMDADHGGFGDAPKFPGTLALSFLIGNGAHDELVRVALDRMAAGGIHDQLGGGFHRYSVDRYWLVPHFEKMLYDQALLADLYAEAWTAYGERLYASVAQGILDYVQREMVSPGGGFYSTQDADSEGVEGKFFVWSPAEVAAVVGEADAELVCRFYDVSEGGNFEGTSILHRTISVEETARMFDRDPGDVARVLDRARAALLTARSERIAPVTDEKILADWNGLMIGAMARTARALDRADQVEVAARAADFVRANLYRDGRLQHFFADGKARVDGFLDDFAFFGRGSLELYYALGRSEDLDSALACCDALIDRFVDAERGGFYFSSVDGEQLIARTRDLFDGAVPAGNSVAVELLLRCYQLTGEDRYREAGEASLAAFLPPALANPYGAAHLLCTAQRYRAGFMTVVIAGAEPGNELERAALAEHAPGAAVLVATPDTRLPRAARGKQALEGRPTAYVCSGSVCSPPVSSAEALREAMRGRSAEPQG